MTLVSGAGTTSDQAAGSPLVVAHPSLARLMPMYLWLCPRGRIRAHGPTLGKIAGPGRLMGRNFFDVFEVRRPPDVSDIRSLRDCGGDRLRLRLKTGADFRAIAVADARGGAVLNLSFGIGVGEAVGTHGLTVSDFAATDLAVELLYLVEAKRAVLGELQRLNQRLQGARQQAEEQALTDTLTGLRNRRALDQALQQAAARSAGFALIHLDLDRFKAVNDSLGHAAGDHVLCVVARRLAHETRMGDVVARVGGDEFVILLPGLTDVAQVAAVADRIIASLANPILFDGQPCQIGASAGITLSTFYPDIVPAQMAQDADSALYAAKRAGRGRVVVFSPAKPDR